jgi:5-methyltetrahydropteroyltriglutamate--homocysteine methyltransferase
MRGMSPEIPPLATCLVGSWPQPDWLLDRHSLAHQTPPRVAVPELWRVDPARLHEAQDDATIVAIRDQERAGLDIITDGEIRRESYSNRFGAALSGIDPDRAGSAPDRLGNPIPVPRVMGPIRRERSLLLEDAVFLRAQTDRITKVTIPGPFTLSQQAQDDHYRDPRALAFAYADVVREEIAELFAAGIDIVQLDEPWMESRAEQAREYGLETLERALDGAAGLIGLHICFGYPGFVPDHDQEYRFLPELAKAPIDHVSIETAQSALPLEVLEVFEGKRIVLGVLALDTEEAETPEEVAARIRRALPHKPATELLVAPDCGMKYLSRASASAKLGALVAGAELVRAEVAAAV